MYKEDDVYHKICLNKIECTLTYLFFYISCLRNIPEILFNYTLSKFELYFNIVTIPYRDTNIVYRIIWWVELFHPYYNKYNKF